MNSDGAPATNDLERYRPRMSSCRSAEACLTLLGVLELAQFLKNGQTLFRKWKNVKNVFLRMIKTVEKPFLG